MPCTASLVLGKPEMLIPILIAAGCCVALTLWSYRHTPMKGPQRTGGLFLKSLAFLLLLLCWIEPQRSTKQPKENANVLALLLDDSQSMQLPSAEKSTQRGEQLLALWSNGVTGWRADLESNFRLRNFTFASSLREMTGGRLPEFQGTTSALGAGLSQIADRIGQKPAGIVVFTDGNASDLATIDPQTLPPIYPVVLGAGKATPDATLGAVSSTQGAFEDAPVNVSAEIRATGMAGKTVSVRVETLPDDTSNTPTAALAETDLKLQSDDTKTIAQLQFTPPHSGPTFYRVTLQLPEEHQNVLSKLKNTRLLCVNRTRGPHPILYIGGRPNWEFPPLRRALDGDPELQLRALIRVAKREPKFQFKGRGGEATNPLFRGFQNETGAELQRYDQPVMVRVNVDSPTELASGFPKTAEELFTYKALIIDHLEAEFFSPDQHRLLQRFVAERGGGLLMLGGMESFQNGGWQGTPLETALPVWIGKEKEPPAEPFQWQITREGLLQPWMRRRKSEAEETKRTKALPVLEVLNAVEGTKPAATVLALAQAGASAMPALVTQRYGLGRSGALLAGDWYRWGLGDPTNTTDLSKLWRQVARWLVTDTPNPVDLSATWDASEQTTKLQVRVRDRDAHPAENADVTLRVRTLGAPMDASLLLHAEPTGEPGVYSVTNTFLAQGAMIAEAVANSSEGVEMGRGEFGWVQDHSESEWRSSTADRAAMETLARQTGGAVVESGDLNQLAGMIKNLPNIATETSIQPLWHTSPLFGLALLCLVSEWFLRRRSGVA